jgi:parallel beta-helix repeat protein
MVLVAPGTYVEFVDFQGKWVTLISEEGAENTIIRGPDSDENLPVITLTKGEPKGTRIEGFTVAHGGKGGIYCENSSPTIQNNIFTENWGGGIKMHNTSRSMIIGNSFSENIGNPYGGAIEMWGICADDTIAYNYMRNWGFGQIRCVGIIDRFQIFNNTINAIEYTAITLQCEGSGNIHHNIFVNAPKMAVRDDFSIATIQYNCDYWVGGPYYSHPVDSTNFRVDPNFCDKDNGDYHLSALSPCSPRNNLSGQLIGALGVACDEFPCGDANQDGIVDELDVEFLQELYYGAQPPGYLAPIIGDMDCDGVITIADLVLLAGYVHGFGPAPCCAEPPPPPPPAQNSTGNSANNGR